jgi:hypothetical protein
MLWWLILGISLTERDNQRANKALFLRLSVRESLEEIALESVGGVRKICSQLVCMKESFNRLGT